jgi:CRISPR-associated exonuclease Cas4
MGMNFSEDNLLPISALQHLQFCPRQCSLIHIEQAWAENRLTAEGRLGHEKVDQGGAETRSGRKTVYGLPLRSLRLGLIGKADVVEFERDRGGRWVPFPVEHKHGRPKQKDCDRVQLCAQALCLEEMTGTDVPEGAIFYGKTRRREDVTFVEKLRRLTEETARQLHALIDTGLTPRADYDKKCGSCSLIELCMPEISTAKRSVERYLSTAGKE